MNMANVMRGIAVATLFASLFPIACGSDSGGSGTKASGTNGTGGNKNTSDGGKTTPTPTTTASSPIPAGDVACGQNVCGPVDGVTGMPCCADKFAGTCGVTNFTGQCTKAPAPQPKECPMLMPIGGFLQLRSCCTTKGECGIDASMFGMGSCINYADAKAQAAMYMPPMGVGGAAGMFGNFMLTLPDTDPPCHASDGGM
jgi:hypothetical protein